MTITPTGAPAQVRTANIYDYGGHEDKRNYQSQGVVNPLTDISAAQFLRMTTDLAACARVAPFCVLTVQCNDTAPAAPTVLRVQQMGVVAAGGYVGSSPPDANLPTLTRLGDGEFDITWPTSTIDDYGVSATVDLAHIFAQIHGQAILPQAQYVSERQVTVALVDELAAPILDATVTIEVS